MKRLPPLDSPTNVLVAAALHAEIEFRPYGAQVRIIGEVTPELRPIVSELKNRKAELRSLLGCDAWQASIDILARLGVTVVVPQTAEEARAVLAEMIVDGMQITPPGVRKRQGAWLGTDSETAALEDEERPPVHLLKTKGKHAPAGHLAKNQPAFKGTAGLDHHRSRIRTLQLYGGGKRVLVLDTNLVPLSAIMADVVKHTLIIHGATFELKFFAEVGYEVPFFEDTQQASALLLGAYRSGLDDAVREYLDIELDKTLQKGDWSPPILDFAQYAYAALDSVSVFKLWLKQRTELYEKGRAAAYILQRNAVAPAVRMIRRGVLPDLQEHKRQIIRLQSEKATAEAAFLTNQGTAPPTTPAETGAFLEEILPLEVRDHWTRTPKTEALSTKSKDLRRHAHLPAIETLLTITAANKLISTFGTALTDKVSKVTGRIHPHFRVASAKSGRFSCASPNLQQIPKNRGSGFRDCFVAETGKTFVRADYTYMELRAGAEISEDVTWRADFAAGKDPHRQRAAAMLKISEDEVSPAQRNAAKPFSFGTIYGAGDGGLVEIAWANFGIILSLEEARNGRIGLSQDHPEYAAWMDQSYRESNAQGFIRIGKLGRVIEAAWEAPVLPDGSYNYRRGDDTAALFNVLLDDGEQDRDTEEYEMPPARQMKLKRTLCVNAPVQGACADASMLALIYVDQAIRDAGIDGGVVLFVHDELVCEVPEADAERTETLMVECMKRAFSETFPEAPLNDLVDTKISTTWGSRDQPATAGTAGDADRSQLPAGRVHRPTDRGDVAADQDQRGRTHGRSPRRSRRLDVPVTSTRVEARAPGAVTTEPATALLSRTCDRCGASPCSVFGESSTFCTLQCWRAAHAVP
jgi:DNA polymerase-1